MLQSVFSGKFIKIGLEAEDKEETFEELADFFCQASGSTRRRDILKAVRDRESKMSTGIKKGIALPHGKTDAVNEVCGVLGISKKGIDYESLDNEPVYLVFLMLAPLHETEKHLRLLKRLAELLDNPQFYTELAAAADGARASEIIRKYEEILLD